MDEEELENEVETPVTEPDETPTSTPTDSQDDTPATDTPPQEDPITPVEDEKIPVKYIQYYVVRTRTKVLTEEDSVKRRIAEWKHSQDPEQPLPDPIEEKETFTLKSIDTEPNCFVNFDEELFEETDISVGLNLESIKKITTQEDLYSYSEDEETGDVVESIVTYDTVLEYFYTWYEEEKDKPVERISGICNECKYCVVGHNPFFRHLCTKHTYTDKVNGFEFALPCRDFNNFGECELWEEIPEEPEEEVPSDDPTDIPDGFGDEDDSDGDNGDSGSDSDVSSDGDSDTSVDGEVPGESGEGE